MAEAPAFYTIYKLPENARLKDYLCYPHRTIYSYVTRTVRVFGWRFLIFLCASQLLLKGMASYMSAAIMFPLLKNVLDVQAYWFQLYSMMAMIPWSIKPIIGLLSDFYLIGGYHKRFWLYNGLFSGMLGCGLLLLFYNLQSTWGITACFFAIQYQVAIFDLMSEARYSEAMREHPYTGTDLVTLVQGYQHVGGLIAMCFVGTMADAALYRTLFIILSLTCVLPLLPTLLGWLPEVQYPSGIPMGNPTCLSRAGILLVDSPEQLSSPWMIAVIAFTGLGAPIAALVSTLASSGYGASLAIVLMSAILLGAYHVFPPLAFRVALYQVIVVLSSPSIGGAMDYFYTSGEQCVPGGPNFSLSYYMTFAGIVGTACSLASVYLYQWVLSGFQFRTVLLVTSVLKGLVGLSDLFIVTRTNIALGIPDKTAYIVGEAVMEPVIGMLNYIPIMTLLSRACPPGMESSVFAFLAGIYNFGSMVSNIAGAFIFQAAGVRTTEPCNFDSLWVLILVCHVGLPLVAGIGCLGLIPRAHQTDVMDLNGQVVVVVTDASLNNSVYLDAIDDIY